VKAKISKTVTVDASDRIFALEAELAKAKRSQETMWRERDAVLAHNVSHAQRFGVTGGTFDERVIAVVDGLAQERDTLRTQLDVVRSEIRETWRDATLVDGQTAAFRILERMVDRLGYERTKDNPSLAALSAPAAIDTKAKFFVQHRTFQETSGSGYRPPDLPWKYDGPFATYAEAKAHWDKIRPDWQVGCVVTTCGFCNQYHEVPAASDDDGATKENSR